MNWKYFNTGFNDGHSNMKIDLQLAEMCRPGEAYFRLYRWRPYCISLGANQDFNSVDTVKAAADGINIVKRPTGGRAILHSEEITYSVIYPLQTYFSFRHLYYEINSALLKGLMIYDKELTDAHLENLEPELNSLYRKEIGQICFAVPAKSEIKFKGRKLVGSAQRKMKNSVLQHGSILCGGFHKNIISYLRIFSSKILEMQEEINNKTTDLKEILKQEVNYIKLAESLLQGFESHFNSGISFNAEDILVMNL